MKVELTAGFLKAAKKLPKALKSKLADDLFLLQNNPFDPLLHSKPLSGKLAGLWSFRVTRDYRVIFLFQSVDIIKVVLVSHRKDIYR